MAYRQIQKILGDMFTKYVTSFKTQQLTNHGRSNLAVYLSTCFISEIIRKI